MARKLKRNRTLRPKREPKFSRWQPVRLAVFAVVGGVLAWYAAAQPATTILTKRNPILAVRLTGSPQAQSTLWMVEALGDPAKLKDDSIVPVAREALAASPLDPRALRALAFHADAVGEGERAERLAQLSQDVSRRDELTQLLLAQQTARKGQTGLALKHLSNAIKTSDEDVREPIFQVMAPMLRQPELRASLPRLLTQDGGWIGGFLDYALRRQPDGAVYVAEVLLQADPVNTAPVYDRLGADLLSSLAEQNKFGLLRRTYARMRGEAPDLTRTAALNPRTIDPKLGWLSWFAAEGRSSGAETEATGPDTAAAMVYAGAGTRDAVTLRRVMMLQPGRYLLFEDREVMFGQDSARAVWKMRCLSEEGARLIWSGPDSALAYRAAGAPTVVIPAGCEAQILELEASSPQGSGGFDLLIRKFDLVRAS